MYYFIFNEDNSYSWHGLEEPAPVMVSENQGQYLVMLPLTAFDHIPEDEKTNVRHNDTTNSLELVEERFLLPSKRAVADLEKQLREYVLIPEEQRDAWYPTLIGLCAQFLDAELLDSIMEDSILSPEEVESILDYLEA